jgi:hypothetical protein
METTMITQIKCDGFAVKFANGRMRLDLLKVSETHKDKDGRPMGEIVGQVIMSPEGLFRSFSTFQHLMKLMAQRGMLKTGTINGKDSKPAEAKPEMKAEAKPEPVTAN